MKDDRLFEARIFYWNVADYIALLVTNVRLYPWVGRCVGIGRLTG